VISIKSPTRPRIKSPIKSKKRSKIRLATSRPALLQALRIVLAGPPLECVDRAKGRDIIDGLLNRLDGASQPFEALEIADETLAAIEADATTARDHRRSYKEQMQANAIHAGGNRGQHFGAEGQLPGADQADRAADRKRLDHGRLARFENESRIAWRRARDFALTATPVGGFSPAFGGPDPDFAGPFDRCIPAGRGGLGGPRPVLNDEPEPQEISYAAIFLLDRADPIARRYGESLRNEVIALVRQHFKKTPKDVSAELRSVASLGRSQYFDVGDRSVLLDTSLTWTVFPQSDFASPDLFFKAVDGFVKQTAAERKPRR
jgi:hypothetical protein